MMKKVVLALLVSALVQPPVAKASYIGSVNRQSGYTLEVAASGGVTTAITFLSVIKGRLEVDNKITVAGNLPPMQVTIPHFAERGILLIDTQGGSTLIRINPGIQQEVTADPEARIVFDITG